MIPGELSRRQLFTETLPQMGAAALMLVGGGERPMPAEQASKLLEIEETRRILFESLSFPDKFSSRTARMRSLYPLAQEVAAELFADEDTPGIDYIIPNTEYLEKRRSNIRGIIILKFTYYIF